jgi:hypothetical protein
LSLITETYLPGPRCLQGEEHEEEEGHYEGETRHYEDKVVGVMDLLQDLHPHVDTRLATLFALL